MRPPEELAGCDGNNTFEPTGPNPSKWRIEVIKVPVASPEHAAIVNEPRLFGDPATGAVNGLQNAPQTPLHPSGMAVGPDADHRRLSRHHRVSEVRDRGRRLRGQRPADRHLEPGQAEADRRSRRPAVRVLARGDVQQRRQDGRVHGRVGRRHGRALPCDRPAQLGRQLDLRHRPRQARLPQLLQDPAGPDRRRRTASATSRRSSRCLVATSSSRPGTRAARRWSTSATRATRSRSATTTAGRSARRAS